ncbi:Sodium:neurotransmitter symporter family protein, partial [Ancylostoma duodenale]
MDSKIIRLRELVSTDANYAAQFYLECVCHADETERILNRTSSRDKKRRKPKVFRDTVSTISAHTIQSVPSTTDFFLSCLGFMVGIGNMLRFPGKICEYGGIFFAPYFFCMIFIGFPMLYLHLCIGQYAGQTADVAFRRLMPVTCGITPEDAQVDFSPLGNVTLTSSELFFHLDILSLTDYTHLTITLPERHIVLALATAWLLVYLGVCRGTTWMSWAIRFTATIPYLMLFILLIRGLSLPGASLGLKFLFSSASDSISSLKGGFFLFHAMDSLISSLPNFILSFLVLISVSYLYGLNKFLSDVSSMLRVPRRSKAKWAHLRLQEKLMELFGPCGTFMRLSWALVCPCFLTILMITHALSYQRPLFFGCHVPMESEFFAWILVHAPVTAAFIGAIMAIVKIRKSGK